MKAPRTATTYEASAGRLLLIAEGDVLAACAFADTPAALRRLGETPLLPMAAAEAQAPVLGRATKWLDACFSGSELPPLPPLAAAPTDFGRRLRAALLRIPRGTTACYAELARCLGTSPRAVGRGVAANPLLVFVPCHRVTGRGRKLLGYAGGAERQALLLQAEAAKQARTAANVVHPASVAKRHV